MPLTSPNENAIRRLIGAILMEQTEAWAVQTERYMRPETLAHSSAIPPSAACP
jgi:hypothetical protein